MKKAPPPELSRIIDATKPDRTYTITPTADELLAVSKRLGLLGLESLTAELSIKRGSGGDTVVRGPFSAKVTQACVVTLEPVDAEVNDELIETFSEHATGEEELDWSEDSNAPEPLIDGKIDLGELLVQHLSLALEPYPRKAGVEFKGYGDAEV
jgi:uncharacterized metal-binding protein YceD (DUF177 family)